MADPSAWFPARTSADRETLHAQLSAAGRARLGGFAAPELSGRLQGGDETWTEVAGERVRAETAPIPVAVREALQAALADVGFALTSEPCLIRHAPGCFGLPETSGSFGFVLDLTREWWPIWGGLLLFSGGAERVEGWRPEAGALTLWRGTPPVLSMVSWGAPARLAVFGTAERA